MQRSAPIAIAPRQASAPLSAQQKKFNRHIEHIARERSALAAWQEAMAAYRTRHARQWQPLQRRYLDQLAALAHYLDQASDTHKLSRADRDTLADAVAGIAAAVADATSDEAQRTAMKELYNRYGDADYDAERAADGAQAAEMAQAMAQDVLGVDLQGQEFASPEAMLQHIQEQAQARMEQAEQAAQERAARRAARKPGARQRKAEQEAAQATQSVREIYRKLASSLHPDRASDPEDRAHKTALMQRVNQAYADNKLLDLLQLQLEIEQIDPAHIAGLGEDKLARYNRVLAGQLRGLQQEVEDTLAQFAFEFQLDPGMQRKPAALKSALQAQIARLELETAQLGAQLRRLRASPAQLKPWLREQRRGMDDWDD
jgi:hypothetical protein